MGRENWHTIKPTIPDSQGLLSCSFRIYFCWGMVIVRNSNACRCYNHFRICCSVPFQTLLSVGFYCSSTTFWWCIPPRYRESHPASSLHDKSGKVVIKVLYVLRILFLCFHSHAAFHTTLLPLWFWQYAAWTTSPWICSFAQEDYRVI